MKFQKDVGYGHTLDLDKEHYLVHDKEGSGHAIIHHDKGELSSGHKTASAAIEHHLETKYSRDTHHATRKKLEGHKDHSEFKKYHSHTDGAIKKSEDIWKAEKDAIDQFMKAKK
jgi:hypothetical protein